MGNKKGIYIHIPFCVRKCNYCAFLSCVADDAPREEYSEALVKEIKLRAKAMADEAEKKGEDPAEALKIDTVYVGGGTPSVLDVAQMREIMHVVNKCFNVKDGAEITIEANPATLGRKDGVMLAKLQAYKFIGFNRLSMGVQSMDNDRLHFLGRIHTPLNVERDMDLIRRKGFYNVNLDLMFSVPGQTTEDALADVKRILSFDPEHISCYSLQIEEGTPFATMVESGEMAEVPDEEDRKTYHKICAKLKEAGYEHYEISNFSKPGYRSQHNSLYWNMDDYVGLGLGASGFLGGVRYKNTSDFDEYFKAIDEGRLPVEKEHVNTAFDNISEAVFTGLRRIEGISYREALDAYLRAEDADESIIPRFTDTLTDPAASNTYDSNAASEAFWEIFKEAKAEAEDYAARGLLIIDNDGLRLTEQGIDISNSIMSLFV